MDDEKGAFTDQDPDAYRDDWDQSFVFKKAMKAEAIKRGEPYDSEYDVDEDDEKVAMTVSAGYKSTVRPRSGSMNPDELEYPQTDEDEETLANA